jgi:hypothetical protein
MPTKSRQDPDGPDPSRQRIFAGLDREKLALIFIPVTIVILALAILAGGVGLTGLTIVSAFFTLILFVGSRRDERQQVEVATNDDATHRVLVLSHEGLGGSKLTDALQSKGDGSAHVRVIVPAMTSALDRLAGDVDEEIGEAESDLERLVGEINSAGMDAEGLVGDSDPTQALEDALKTYAADEVIVVNPPQESMGRLERAATFRAKDAAPIPFTELHV